MQAFQRKPVRAEPADQHPGSNHGTALILRRRLRHFCLISPHQKASICNADSVYFRKGGSESLDSFYNKMNGLVNFFQKTAPNLENFNDLYYSKLWVPRKIEGRESQTKLKKTRKERFQRTCFATWPSKEGSRPITDKNSWQQGSTGIHSQEELQAHPAALQALRSPLVWTTGWRSSSFPNAYKN